MKPTQHDFGRLAGIGAKVSAHPSRVWAPKLLAALLIPCGLPSFAEMSAADVYEVAAPSVVTVETYTEHGVSNSAWISLTPILQGSGVVVGTALILSNCHVVVPGTSWVVKHQGKEYKATQIKYPDPERDLCVLEVPGFTGRPVQRRTDKLRVGETVYTIGAPRGLELTLAQGLISGLRESGEQQGIQTSAPISPGSSGGGLFDSQGRLVGITTYHLIDSQELNFAMPVEWIDELPARGEKYKALRRALYKKYAPACLGAEYASATAEVLAKTRLQAKEWTEKDPFDPAAWTCLGHSSQDYYSEAVEAFEKAVDLGPVASAYVDLGMAHLMRAMLKRVNADEKWNYEESERLKTLLARARQAFESALEIDEDQAESWVRLSQVFELSEQPKAALVAATRATKADPNSSLAWSALAAAYLDTGDAPAGLRAARQAVALETSVGNWLTLKIAAEATGDQVTARHAESMVSEGLAKSGRK